MVLYDGREEYRVIDIKGVQYDVQVSVQIVKFVKLIHTFVVSVLCQNIDTHTFIHTHTHTHTHTIENIHTYVHTYAPTNTHTSTYTHTHNV